MPKGVKFTKKKFLKKVNQFIKGTDHFERLAILHEMANTLEETTSKEESIKIIEEPLDGGISINVLQFPERIDSRIKAMLIANKINTIYELSQWTRQDFLALKSVGPKIVEYIDGEMKKRGYEMTDR